MTDERNLSVQYNNMNCGLYLFFKKTAVTTKLFEEIYCDPNHKLHHLLPEVNRSSVNLRNRRKFNLAICKTNRLRNSFIFSNSEKKITSKMNNF